MDYIAQAIDRHTGIFGTCTITDKELAYKIAKYYRSIGYRAKVFSADEYKAALEENAQMRYAEIKKQEEAQRYE